MVSTAEEFLKLVQEDENTENQPQTADEFLALIQKEEGQEPIPEIPTGPIQGGSEQALAQAAQQPQATKLEPETMRGIGEAAAAIATGGTTGFAGYIGGTLTGLAKEIASGNFGTQEAAQRIQQLANETATAATYQPRSKTGGEFLETLEKLSAPLAPLGQPLSQSFSLASMATRGPEITMAQKEALEIMNRPSNQKRREATQQQDQAIQAQQAAQPMALEPMEPTQQRAFIQDQGQPIEQQQPLALEPMEQTDLKPSLFQQIQQQPEKPLFEILFSESRDKQEIRKSIEDGTIESVGWRLDEKDKVVPAQDERELIKEGFSERLIGKTKRMNNATRQQSLRMINLAEKKLRGTEDRIADTPQMIAGENILKRYDAINKYRLKAAEDISNIAKFELTNYKNIDGKLFKDSFAEDLKALDIKVNPDNTLDFEESLVVGTNLTPLIRVWDRLKNNENFKSGFEMHRLKQFIDSQISSNDQMKLETPLKNESRNALLAIRSDLNNKLRSLSKNYEDANQRYYEAANTITPFYKAAGRNFDPESSYADNKIGQEFRKVVSNYAKGPMQADTIELMDQLANKIKPGGFQDDIFQQIDLSNDLISIVGPMKSGEATAVVERAITGAVDKFIPTAGLASEGIKALITRRSYESDTRRNLKRLKDLRKLIKENRPKR